MMTTLYATAMLAWFGLWAMCLAANGEIRR